MEKVENYPVWKSGIERKTGGICLILWPGDKRSCDLGIVLRKHEAPERSVLPGSRGFIP